MDELTRSEKISLGTKEIAKMIRGHLKIELPDNKFSVVIERYAGGSSITVSMMESGSKIIKDFKDLDVDRVQHFVALGHTKESIEKGQAELYHQLNPYTLRTQFDSEGWCNGVFLTEEGHSVLQKVVSIVDRYNYDDSDSMTDYYCVNFAFSIGLGHWDKPFVDGGVSSE